jgi:ribosome assembly protein YihI (activator of Der GTPase)
MDAGILVMIFYGIGVVVITWISVMMEIEKLEKKLRNLDEYLDQLYDRVDVIGKEVGKMWIDITKLDKKIEKIMKNEGGEE